jgi:hypothetical protein
LGWIGIGVHGLGYGYIRWFIGCSRHAIGVAFGFLLSPTPSPAPQVFSFTVNVAFTVTVIASTFIGSNLWGWIYKGHSQLRIDFLWLFCDTGWGDTILGEHHFGLDLKRCLC